MTLLAVLILLLTSLSPLFTDLLQPHPVDDASLYPNAHPFLDTTAHPAELGDASPRPTADDSTRVGPSTAGRAGEMVVWNGSEQPWPQQGRDPGRASLPPAHSPDGGAGSGTPADASEQGVIEKPALNWAYGSEAIDTDSLASVVGDFSAAVQVAEGADERCGGSSLFPVVVRTRDVGGTDHSFLTLIEGEDAEKAWEVDLGATERVKAAPMIADIDADGKPEIVVVFDAQSILTVQLWSPRLTCGATGWSSGGHSGERLWTYTDETLEISSDDGPYTAGWAGNHHPTAQPVIADLDLDGVPELAIPAVSNLNDRPVIVALPLPDSSAPNPMWTAELSKGTHPSDLAWAQLDSETSAVLLTTIDADDGSMWVWRLDGETGSSQWGGSTLNNLDGGASDAPHIRLPGPIIVQLDSDAAPEMVVTIPSDFDGAGSSDGAEFVAVEVTSGAEIWKARANDGFADAAPVAIDTDGDGIDDRICWVTWWQTSSARHGSAGCHDVSGSTPILDWTRPLEQSSGNPNDEIAVASPVWMDIDGTSPPELLVAYGRSLWALDGDTGTGSAISTEWADEFTLPHRTWASPALADVDGDALLDIIIGGMVISHSVSDVRPFLDGTGIEFNPSAPDPGENISVTAYIENVGTVLTDDDVDVVLFVGGVEIGRDRLGLLDPMAPSGSGTYGSFSVQWTGGLGTHVFTVEVDPGENVSQSRLDNDLLGRDLRIVAPYNVSIGTAPMPVRIDPGSSVVAQPIITSTGRLSGTWDMSVDPSGLPTGWTWSDETPDGITGVVIGIGQTWVPHLRIAAPAGSLGTDRGHLILSMSPAEDPSTNISSLLPVEANRTRGLSVRGPDGTNTSSGFGLIGDEAAAWLIVENLGNAAETTSAITWESTIWGSDLRLVDSTGTIHPTLTIGPGESIELTARIDVNSSADIGDQVSTPLSICIGGDAEQQCQRIELDFTANDVALIPPHVRSTPTTVLTWNLKARIPNGASELEWDLAAAAMNQPGWVWDSGGAVSIIGGSLFVHGAATSTVTGSISLTLPEAAPPGIHHFDAVEANHTGADLSFSLRILQVYRASISLIAPTDEVNRFEVGVPFTATLRLQNPGNGPDDYALSAAFVATGNLSSDPGLEVSFPSTTVSLSAGSLTNIPVTLTAPEDTPARLSFTLRFTSASLDSSVFATVDLVLEARQDHRWNLSMSSAGENLSDGGALFALPGETVSVLVRGFNIGNHDDALDLAAAASITATGSDSGVGWDATAADISRIDVGENGTALVDISVPFAAWNGTIADITVAASANGFELPGATFTIEVAHIAAWAVHAAGADLDIDPAGDQMTLQVEQLGNDPARPGFTTWVTGALGWQVAIASQPDSLDPTAIADLVLNITPPASARAGQTVELHIRVRNPDSSGVSEVTFPVRVSATVDHSLSGGAEWLVSPEGGMPLAWVTNLGNGPTTIDIEVIGVPSDWLMTSTPQIHLAIGESVGLPIDLIPTNWSGEEVTITIRTTDAAGQQRELLLPLVNSSHAWVTSPLLVAIAGDSLSLAIHGATSVTSASTGSGTGLSRDGAGFRWIADASDSGNGTLIVDGVELPFHAIVHDRLSRSATCSLHAALNSSDQGYCDIANGSAAFDYTIILTDGSGNLIQTIEGTVAADAGALVNISHGWNPVPGMHTLTLRLIDTHGGVRGSDDQSYVIRDSDWNLGIIAIELEGDSGDQRLAISIQRSEHDKLTDADCTLAVSADGWNSTHVIDVTGPVAPKFRLSRPPLPDGTEIEVTIGCATPWDIDSDSADDSKRIVLSGQTDIVSGSIDAVTGISMAAIVLLIMWVLGMIRPRSETLPPPRKQQKSTTESSSDQVDRKTPLEDESISLSEPEKKGSEPGQRQIEQRAEGEDGDGSEPMVVADEGAATEAASTEIEEVVDETIDEETAEFERLMAATDDEFERRLLRLRFNRRRGRGGL